MKAIKSNDNQYRNSAIFLFAVAFIYLLFTIGDVVVKGYSDLPSYPFTICIIIASVFLGIYIRQRKQK